MIPEELQPEDFDNEADQSRSISLCRRILTSCVAIAASTIAFNLYSFVVYLNDVKSYFHLTQSQAEMIISMNFLGMTSTLPAGFIIGRYGIRAGVLLALFIPPVAYGLIYSATKMVTFYHGYFPLLAMYFFLAGCGSGVTYLVAMTAATPMFPSSRRGTIVALVSSGTNIGALLFMLLYTILFQNGSSGEKPNLTGFFGMIGITFSVINLFGLLIYRETGPKDKGYTLLPSKPDHRESDTKTTNIARSELSRSKEEDKSEQTTLLEEKAMQKYGFTMKDLKIQKGSLTDIESGYLGSSEDNSDRSDELDSVSPASSSGQLHDEEDMNRAISLRKLMVEPVFHLMGWACIITIGLVSMDLNNLVVFTVSLEMTQLSEVLPYVAVGLGLIGKLSIGYISDVTIHRIQRATYIFIVSAANTAFYCLCIFYIGNPFVLVMNPVFVTTSSVVMFSLAPTILSEYFGNRSFAKCWGILYFGTAVSGFVFQNVLGGFYDIYVPADSLDQTCYGTQCFRWSFLVAAVMTGLATVLVGFFIVYHRRIQRQ